MVLTQEEAEAQVRAEKEAAPTGTGTAALSERGIKTKAAARVKRSKSTSKSSTAKVTVREPLTNEQIIEQNKKLLADIDERRKIARAQGNKELERKLSQQYNDIAKQSNIAIKEENVLIEKAKTTTEFANLFPEKKAREIVEASGLQKYIIEKQQTKPPTKKAGAQVKQKTKPLDRFVYDPKRKIWIDTQTKQDQAEMRSSLGVFLEEHKRKLFMLNPDDLKPKKPKGVGEIVFGIDYKSKASDVKAETSFKFTEKQQELATEGKLHLSQRDKPGEVAIGLGFAGASVVTGGARFVFDLVTDPVEVAAGVVETVANPVGSFVGLSESLYKDPFGTVGYLGAQGVVFKGAPKVVKAGIEKGRAAHFEFKIEKGRVYDQDFIFDRVTGSRSVVTSEGAVLPEKQSVLYYNPNVRAPPEPSIKFDYSIQKELSRPVEFVRKQEFVYRIKDPVARVDVSTPKGSVSILAETPTPSETLRSQRFAMEQAARGSAKPGEQTKLIKKDTKLKPLDKSFFVVEDKPTGKKFFFEVDPNNPVYFSLTGGVAETLFKAGVDLFERFDEGRSRVKPLTPEVVAERSASISKGKSQSGLLPVVYIGTARGQERGFLTAQNVRTAQSPVLTQTLPDKTAFEPIGKYDLYQGVKEIQLIKQSQGQSQKGRVKVLVGQDVSQSLKQGQDITQDQIQIPKEAQVVDQVTRDPFQEVTETTTPPPPPNIRTPPPFRTPPQAPEPSSLKMGFSVFVRRKGRFGRVSDQPLMLEEAKQLGASIVGRTAAATFKLVPTKTRRLGSFSGRGNLRDFYQKGSLYIEKRGRRIKSRGEIEEITLKGLAALRSGKRRIGLFGGL